MRHFTTGLSLFTCFLIIIMTMCFTTCSAKMTGFLLKREADLAVSRGTMGIVQSEQLINEALSKEVEAMNETTFNKITRLIYDTGITISEEEANEIFRKGLLSNLEQKIGSGDEELATYLESKLPDMKSGRLSIDRGSVPKLQLQNNQIVLNSVPVRFDYKELYSRRDTFDVRVNIPSILLYDGNDEIFSYSMIAKKGIYITGKTSTVFGNIYAGVHGPSDMRKAEALYGEKNRYGGLNIMSTQVALYGDKIVSEGDINLRGSFVLMGSEEKPMTVYTKSINEMDNIASPNIYALIGKRVEVSDYPKEKDAVNEACEMFSEIDFFYDSNNDKTYQGDYRKIMSSTDVTISSDVTGIVITPRSVIVNEGVNVAGLIISGDRIYIQGNNNIVSSPEVLHAIIKEELTGEAYGDGYADVENISSVHLNVVDYLGGIDFRGIK